MRTLLLTVDALRATHLGQYGYYRDTMPALDRLAADGKLYDRLFSTHELESYTDAVMEWLSDPPRDVFHLEADPCEHVSDAGDPPDVVRAFDDEIPGALFDLEPPGTRAPDDEVDEERLAALGYMEV
jgi:hypothetical protein